jgi:hypothetical protein
MAQMELDELFFNALMADADLVLAVSGRIESTCFEVSPDGEDNTQLPCIIVTDDGLTSQPTDKDVEWESSQDRVQASVGVSAIDPKEVKTLIRALADGGMTILTTSHLLADAEDICDRVMIVNRGKCVAEGAIGELGTSLEEFFLAKVGDVRDFKLARFLKE